MAKIVFLQSRVSQLDEPVYDRIYKTDPNLSHVIYWNDEGLERTRVDAETGVFADISSGTDYHYPYTWVDSSTRGLKTALREINAHEPDWVVLQDVASREREQLSLLLRSLGTQTFLRSDKNVLSDGASSGVGLSAERRITKLVYAGLAPVSDLTEQYYAWPANRPSVKFSYTTNEEKFAPAPKARLEARMRLRTQLGICSSDHVFLAAAKFINRENPWDILTCFERLQELKSNACLIALGDGPLLKDIVQFCIDRQIRRAFFPGFVPFSQLEDYFFASDTYLHFARCEPWGVSPQDALIAGLGIVCSDKVGSASILLQGKLRRYLLQLDQLDDFVSAMANLAEHPDVAGLFAPARVAAEDFTVAACARGWIDFADQGLRRQSAIVSEH